MTKFIVRDKDTGEKRVMRLDVKTIAEAQKRVNSTFIVVLGIIW